MSLSRLGSRLAANQNAHGGGSSGGEGGSDMPGREGDVEWMEKGFKGASGDRTLSLSLGGIIMRKTAVCDPSGGQGRDHGRLLQALFGSASSTPLTLTLASFFSAFYSAFVQNQRAESDGRKGGEEGEMDAENGGAELPTGVTLFYPRSRTDGGVARYFLFQVISTNIIRCL